MYGFGKHFEMMSTFIGRFHQVCRSHLAGKRRILQSGKRRLILIPSSIPFIPGRVITWTLRRVLGRFTLRERVVSAHMLLEFGL